MTVTGARERGQRRRMLEKNDSYQGIASALPRNAVFQTIAISQQLDLTGKVLHVEAVQIMPESDHRYRN